MSLNPYPAHNANRGVTMNDRHTISPYPIRMPAELRAELEQSAKDGSRSLHAEIISRLEDSFLPQRPASVDIPEAIRLLMQVCEDRGVKVQIILGEVDEDED